MHVTSQCLACWTIRIVSYWAENAVRGRSFISHCNVAFAPNSHRSAASTTIPEPAVTSVDHRYQQFTDLRGKNLVVDALADRHTDKRQAISEDIKLLVWTRDGGACTRCAARQQLHFDHVIPVAKGGGNSAENIQLLCQPCNLRKSDKVAF